MSMYRGNEGGSVWVYFYKHISQVPSTLSASLKILQLYLCWQKGSFDLFSLICGIVAEWDNQV